MDATLNVESTAAKERPPSTKFGFKSLSSIAGRTKFAALYEVEAESKLNSVYLTTMSIQYITDSEGKTTGVFIPIEEWNALKSQLPHFDISAEAIPDWQKDVVRDRIRTYKENPSRSIPFEKGMDDIDDRL